MTAARLPALIPLGFAVWWLWMGVAGFAPPWQLVAGVAGSVALAGVAVLVLARAARQGGPRMGFGRHYLIVVAVEVAALVIAANMLLAVGRMDRLLPVIGIIVGLHFIGLYWAWPARRLLWLAAALTILNLGALLLPDPRALSGLGSALFLGLSVGLP